MFNPADVVDGSIDELQWETNRVRFRTATRVYKLRVNIRAVHNESKRFKTIQQEYGFKQKVDF